MSKARSMYAGSSGMVNGTNAMCVQIGNKLQGLPPTTNKPARLINHITTKAEGDKRDYIFCINQLAGGVGRNVGQFAPGADGVKDCKTGKYTTFNHCSTILNLEAVNEWVRTDLSSLFATMNQGAGNIVTNMAQAYGYFGLAIIPKAKLSSNNIYSAVAGSGTNTATLISYMMHIDAFANPDTTFASTLNNTPLPILDIMEYITNGSGAATNLTNLNNDPASYLQPSNLPAFVSALQSSIDSKPDVKNTLAKLLGKDIKVPGSNDSHALVIHLFSEQFIQTQLFNDMKNWLVNAISVGDRGVPNIWHVYRNSSGANNGFTYGMNARDFFVAPQYRTNFINTCDTSVFAIPGCSDHPIPGAHDHVYNSIVPSGSITSVTTFSIE